jgi:hypothetical protein
MSKSLPHKHMPAWHFALHNGRWSVIHRGQAMCAPTTELHARAVLKHWQPDATETPVWATELGAFIEPNEVSDV